MPLSAPRVQKPRRAAPADAVRPTRAEINLGNLRRNLHVLRKASQGAAIYGVLKADGYGHGAPAVARTLERAGVDGFAVALLEEAIELRDAGITRPLMVMGGYYGQAWGEVIAAGVTPVVYDPAQVEGLSRTLRYMGGSPVAAHLKVDTGMARLGARGASELSAMLDAFARFPEVRLEGLMTHLACADDESGEATRAQLALFEEMSAEVLRAGFKPTVRHVSNSAGLLSGHVPAFEICRPGVALYGVSPRAGLGNDLAPVMRVRSEIVALRDVAPGEGVGYGWSFKPSQPTRIATVPIGYADGLPRSLSNRGHMLVRGKRAPIVGAVSMDMVMIDVTDVQGASVRDEVVALGPQQGPLGRDAITAEEVAEHAGTIPWEVLTNISRRVPRFYREP